MQALLEDAIQSLGGIAKVTRRTAKRREGESSHQRMTIAALCWKYLDFAETYYFKTDTGSARETVNIELALRPLRKLYGRLPASEFSPLKLKAVREAMIEKGWCRRHINHQVGRIKRMLKWATENEMILPANFHAVQAVVGLRYGRSKAPESSPVKPVPEALIEGVLAHVSTPVSAMINLQLLTGMRPGEVVIMRAADIDRSVDPWVYRPLRHKTAHHGHERVVFLGPKAQAIVIPFILRKAVEQYLFSPVDADRERREILHARRKTPLSCGNKPGSNVKAKPKKKPRERYDPNSYAGAVSYACKRASPPCGTLDEAQKREWNRQHHWHPHQLRHNAATRLRKNHGLEVAQVVLGHQTLSVTQVYAERDTESAQRVMADVG